MANRSRLLAAAGTAIGVGAGIAAQRKVINKKRRKDPEREEPLGERRCERSMTVDLEDGASLFVEECGPTSAQGVVFVHGSVLSTDVWHYQMALETGQRMVFADLRGHGRSTKGEAPYSIKTLAGDLLSVIDAVGLEEAVVVGHSVGGQVALQLAHDHPELKGSKIKGLVLVNTSYGPFTETLLASGVVARIERLARRPLDVLGKQHERIEKLRRLVRPSDALFWGVALAAFGQDPSPKHIDFTYDMLARTPVDVILDLVKSYRDFDMTETLGEIDVPALVVGGTQDRLTLPKASHFLAAGLPKADLHIFEGCGHMTMLERHDEFNKLLAGFVTETFGAAAETTRRTGTR